MSKKRIILLSASILIIAIIIAFACYSLGLKKGPEVVQKNNEGQTAINNNLQTTVNTEWLCVPGEKVGQITNKSTEDDLKRIYGNQNVISAKELIEEGTREVTITYIYKGTNNEIKVLWEDGKTFITPSWVWISNNGSKWVTPEGITIGTSLEDLQKINKDIFIFNGFRWDYGGVVTSWGKGNLSKYNKELQITMSADEYSNLPNKYCGDGISIYSNDEGVKKYKVRVVEMRIALSKTEQVQNSVKEIDYSKYLGQWEVKGSVNDDAVKIISIENGIIKGRFYSSLGGGNRLYSADFEGKLINNRAELDLVDNRESQEKATLYLQENKVVADIKLVKNSYDGFLNTGHFEYTKQ